jgi:predicted Zn-dependent protease with MMP-like domain
MMNDMTRDEFAQLVAQALDELPDEFAKRLENVEVVVEDEPSAQLLRQMRLDPHRQTLFGLYQGVPLPERGASYGMTLPDKITIFYGPLVRMFQSPAAIRREIVRTVVHEIGHFFGLDDAAIRNAGF